MNAAVYAETPCLSLLSHLVRLHGRVAGADGVTVLQRNSDAVLAVTGGVRIEASEGFYREGPQAIHSALRVSVGDRFLMFEHNIYDASAAFRVARFSVRCCKLLYAELTCRGEGRG